MSITFEAIYEDGVLKPEKPLPLKEHEKVRVTIQPATSWVEETAGMIQWKGTPEELQRFAEDPELDFPSPPEYP
jgi:predicted DNA-binding antitoxin AbrB/MazE fold protein